jgi:hypothetical protein
MLRRIAVLGVFAVAVVGSTALQAAGQRTFVSTAGDNGNPCTLPLPCRGIKYAIDAVNPGGEVIVMDSNGYGSFTVTKSVSIIVPPGVYAGMSPSAGTDGVTINAGPNDVVVIRGLTINGQGGNRGIVVNSAKQVQIENVTIANMTLDAVQINAGGTVRISSSTLRSNAGSGVYVSASATTQLRVYDSAISDNGGVAIYASTGVLDVSRVTAEDNYGGIAIANPPGLTTVAATVADSVLSGNAHYGAAVWTGNAGSQAVLTIIRTTASHNAEDGFTASTSGVGTAHLVVTNSTGSANARWGVSVNGIGATTTITNSTFLDNQTSDTVQAAGGVLRSFVNNTAYTVTGTRTPFSQY